MSISHLMRHINNVTFHISPRLRGKVGAALETGRGKRGLESPQVGSCERAGSLFLWHSDPYGANEFLDPESEVSRGGCRLFFFGFHPARRVCLCSRQRSP